VVEIIWIFVGLAGLIYMAIDTAQAYWSHMKLMKKVIDSHQEDVNRLETDFELENQKAKLRSVFQDALQQIDADSSKNP
jgi:hypothetical protein